MSTVSKVFVILNLVFALVYAGVAATLLQKQEHWKYKFHQEVAAHNTESQELNEKIVTLNQELTTEKRDVEDWRKRYDDVKTQLDDRQNDYERLDKRWHDMKGNYDSLVEKYDALAADLDKVQRQKDELQEKLNTAESEKGDAILLRDQAVDDRQRIQKEYEDLKVDLGNLKRRHVSLAKKKAELEWVIAQVEEKLGAEVLKNLFAPPKIDGAVIGVSSRVNLIVINVGEEDGVRAGFEFTIYRGNSYVGKMVVEKVYPRQAAGRVMLEMTKDKVQQGDRVSTHVY